MRLLAAARKHTPAREPSGAWAYSRSISTRGSFLASGARGTGGTDFTRTSSGAGLTTGAFAAFFASRARGARGSSISLGREKGSCHIPVDSGAPPRPQRSPPPPHLCPSPATPPPPRQSSSTTVTYRGAGGTDSASSTRETSSTLAEENREVRGSTAP